MAGAYLTGLPVKFLRKAAGFSATEGSYFLARAQVKPPPQLLRLVWPQLEGWQDRVAASLEGKKWKAGGLKKPDLATARFLSFLMQLRLVFLQDAALLQERFPTHPIFGHSLFRLGEWADFARQVQLAQAGASESRSALLERALPEINSTILAVERSLSCQNETNFRRMLDLQEHNQRQWNALPKDEYPYIHSLVRCLIHQL